jgi:putative sugar O-methyltransferase
MTWILNDSTKEKYINSVRHILMEKNVENLRKDKNIQSIFEHVRENQGYEYVKKIPQNWLNENLSEIHKNEIFFKPEQTINIEGFSISPTSLRYAWNCYEIGFYLPINSTSNIVEIGAGYGGLCRMLCGLNNISTYTIIDIPEVSLLAKKYNENYNINVINLSCLDYKNHISHKYDIFISNYALSELDKKEQDGYLSIASKTPYGYITYNSQPKNKHLQYSKEEMKNIISNNRNIQFICHNENITKSENEMIILSVHPII